ncbi:MAG: hypothetical protein IIC67_05615, partial [Thaumarchaeota archaeon]|nr:hypothetical protein [Nitrososphaerota archaeon]
MPQNLSTQVETLVDHQQSFSPFTSDLDKRRIQDREDRANDLLLFSVPAVAAGFADTFGTSIGVLDEGELVETLKNNVPRFGEFYERDKVAFQTVGDLTGMFIPGMAALKAYRSTGILLRAITKGKVPKLLETIFTRAGRFEKALADLRARDMFLAKAGQLDLLSDAQRSIYARNAIITRVADVLKENIA